MAELTLESLAARVQALEAEVAEQKRQKKDWRRVVGMFSGSEFMQEVDAEGAAIRQAERDTIGSVDDEEKA